MIQYVDPPRFYRAVVGCSPELSKIVRLISCEMQLHDPKQYRTWRRRINADPMRLTDWVPGNYDHLRTS